MTEINGSMVTASRKDRTVTRNSSTFKLYRHVEFDLPDIVAKEATMPTTPNPEGREEAEPEEEEAVSMPQDHATHNPATLESEMPMVAQQAASAPQIAREQSTASKPKPSKPKTSQAKPGRPTTQDAEANRQARQEAEAARRAMNPPTRASERLKKK